MTTTVVNVMLMGDDGVDDVMDFFVPRWRIAGRALAPRPRARASRWQSLALADPDLLSWAHFYRWQSLALAEPGATYDTNTGWAWNGSERDHSTALSASS